MEFPHAPLKLNDVTPRISLGQAKQLIELTEKLHLLGKGGQESEPAIMMAFFCKNALVKFVVNGDEAADTIDNMTRALSKEMANDQTDA